jgi:hypothetical protein
MESYAPRGRREATVRPAGGWAGAGLCGQAVCGASCPYRCFCVRACVRACVSVCVSVCVFVRACVRVCAGGRGRERPAPAGLAGDPSRRRRRRATRPAAAPLPLLHHTAPRPAPPPSTHSEALANLHLSPIPVTPYHPVSEVRLWQGHRPRGPAGASCGARPRRRGPRALAGRSRRGAALFCNARAGTRPPRLLHPASVQP